VIGDSVLVLLLDVWKKFRRVCLFGSEVRSLRADRKFPLWEVLQVCVFNILLFHSLQRSVLFFD
jgi:hypothetical protein